MENDLIMLVAVAGALAGTYRVWQISLDAREAANRIAKDTCSRAVVQFLDGTVAFAGFRLTRDSRGKRRLLRTYTFDYTSDGFERAQGFIVLAGAASRPLDWPATHCERRTQHRPAYAFELFRWVLDAGRAHRARGNRRS